MNSLYIRDPQALTSLVTEIRGVSRLAVDTEFVRERQYYPQLEIVQIATEDVEAVIDYRALGTLEPFPKLLNDPRTLKVLHAGYQDLEIFFNLTGAVPAPLFDTQVAAAMVGLGAQVGYARLVETLLGKSIRKSETLTDWAKRPLSKAQIEYALNDVRYLLDLHEKLKRRLEEMGRDEWLEDEWEAMTDPDSYRRVHPNEAYRHVQGVNRLRGHELPILRELAAWREREGIRRDRVPSHIVRDNILAELARRAPETIEGLHEIRGLHHREIERNGKEILAAIQRGKEVPRKEWPRLPERSTLSDQESSLVVLMQAWLRARADAMNIAANYLATSSELRALVTASPEERMTFDVLRGWRRRLVGADLLALLEGQASLAWEPETERLKLINKEGAR
ncbi:MAG: ribonuclease D [Chloroflexota bacterium]|nr:ribonuclease D [Chloroflexota bacterium]